MTDWIEIPRKSAQAAKACPMDAVRLQVRAAVRGGFYCVIEIGKQVADKLKWTPDTRLRLMWSAEPPAKARIDSAPSGHHDFYQMKPTRRGTSFGFSSTALPPKATRGKREWEQLRFEVLGDGAQRGGVAQLILYLPEGFYQAEVVPARKRA